MHRPMRDAESSDERPAATDESPVESLPDPELLLDREDVEFREETKVVEPERFETFRERTETIDGVTVVGVTNDDGAVLLTGHEDDGWRPTGGGVEPGEDWAAAGRRTAEAEAGVPIVLDRPEVLKRYTYRLEGGDDREVDEYFVFFRGSLADESATDLSDLDSQEDATVGWFDEVPENAYPGEEEAIRVFLD